MNPRIRELAEQAALATNEDPNGEYPAHMMQKFAELIVRECADLLEVEWGEEKLSGNVASYVVKKHFGVES